MQHVQGYTGSHWMPPTGNYSLCIAPVVARVAGKTTTMKNTFTLLVVPMAMGVCWYNNACIA